MSELSASTSVNMMLCAFRLSQFNTYSIPPDGSGTVHLTGLRDSCVCKESLAPSTQQSKEGPGFPHNFPPTVPNFEVGSRSAFKFIFRYIVSRNPISIHLRLGRATFFFQISPLFILQILILLILSNVISEFKGGMQAKGTES